jgi:hypothetical protein
MKIIKRTLVFALIAFGATAAVAEESLPLAEAKPGRTGVCITEMDGGERVEIPLTVLGTVGSGTPEGEMVLVRLDDPRFEHTGIIAGMSGSPVYLDGRLLGALAFGWPFAKDPIGGVTPFERMLEIEATGMPPASLAARPEMQEILAAIGDRSVGRILTDWLVPDRAGPQPLPVAIAVGGAVSSDQSGWIGEAWRRMGWVASPGGAAAGEEAAREVTPGSMVAAILVDGDASLAAGGTVTEVRGDRLWAFGHPSLGAGTVDMPLSQASVVSVMPSLYNSFKFFTVGRPIGAMIADRRAGILGRLGAEAPMVPIRVSIGDRQYGFRSVHHPVLLPLLSGYLTQASLGVRGRTFGDVTLDTLVEVRYEDTEPARVAVNLAGAQAAGETAAFVGAVVGYLEASSFEVPEIESVDIRVESSEGLRSAEILEIVPERRVVQPGEELAVRFRLRPHRGEEMVQTVMIKVPEGTPEGRLDLIGADGAAWTVYDLQMRPLRPASFSDEVRLVNSLQPSTELVVALERRDPGIAVAGGSLSTPPSIVMQLQSALGPNLETTAYTVFAKSGTVLPYPVSGAQRIPLTVRRGIEE